MTKSLIVLISICLLIVPSSASALSYDVDETILPNGLKVLLLENHKAPVVTFQVWYRVGSRNEAWRKTGLSHMLEHMMFKGTAKVGPEEFSRLVQANGGQDNAFTSKDFTAYFTNISIERLQVPLELESDRMSNLRLRAEDFQTERMVVMEERRLRTEDNPQAYLIEQVEAAAFQIQPYHWPVIGWMEDIRGFTIEDLKAYYNLYYNPANAFLVVVGDFKKEEVLSRIEKAFGPIPKGAAPDQARDREEPQAGERRVLVKKEAQLAYLTMGHHVPNIDDPDAYVLEVIGSILSEGASSRLQRKLVREKRIALSVDCDYSLVSRDPSLFTVSAGLLPDKNVAEVEGILDEELERLRKETVTEEELLKAKNQLEAAFVYSQDSLFFQAMVLAEYEIVSGWRKINDYLTSIGRVSQADIMRVAKKYLIKDNRTVGILEPIPPKEGKAMPAGPSGTDHLMR